MRGAALIVLLVLAACGRETLTPGFPSEVELSAKLPSQPFLDFSIAVLTRKDVGRGSVRFRVRLSDGDRQFSVFEEVVRAHGGEEFLARSVNLAAWRGRRLFLC